MPAAFRRTGSSFRKAVLPDVSRQPNPQRGRRAVPVSRGGRGGPAGRNRSGRATAPRGTGAGAAARSGRPAAGRTRADVRTGPRPASAGTGARALHRVMAMPPIAFFGAAAALLVIVLVIVAAMVAGGGEDATRARSGPGRPVGHGISPSSYSDSPSTEVFTSIDQRSEDPRPLTVDEVFPSSARTLPGPGGKGRLTLGGKRLDIGCAEAVWGTGVGDVLGKGGCTQAVRGVYTGDRYGMTVAVFNMTAAEDADRLARVLGEGGGFVKPLNGFGRGFSMARGVAMGHYVVVGWVERIDGKGDAQDEALLSLLVEAGGAKAVLGRAARSR